MSRTWIQTFTGKRVNPLNMRPSDIDIVDIAVSLSRQCRFTGHTKWFYSVAHHCYVMSRLVPEELALTALLHDASEAYLADIARPLKRTDCYAQYREAEERLEAVIAAKFDLPFPWPEEIREWDNRLGAHEARILMDANEDWGEWVIGQRPLDLKLEPMPMAFVADLYEHRFNTLTNNVKAAA